MELISSGDGSAGLDAVESGAADIAFVNPFTLIKANQAGRDLVIVGGAQISTADTNVVIVKSGRGIDRPAALEDATLGSNEIGGLGHEMTKAWIAGDGGDPEKVEFVALGRLITILEDAGAIQEGTDAADLVPEFVRS